MSPRDKQDYVQVPFSPAYVSAFIERFRNESNLSDGFLEVCSKTYPAVARNPQNYSQLLIDNILKDSKIGGESRVWWRVGKDKNEKRFQLTQLEKTNQAVDEMISCARGKGIILGEDEVKALLAFASSSFPMGLPNLQGGAANGLLVTQGGVLNGCVRFFLQVFLSQLYIIAGGCLAERIISKPNAESLSVCNQVTRNTLYAFPNRDMSLDAVQYGDKSGKDLIIYRDNYSIVKNNDDNGFTLSVDSDNHEVLIDKNIWAYIIKIAREKLAVTDFNDVDLFAFIPCLCDPNFLEKFLEKFDSSKPKLNQQVLNNIFKYAHACCGSGLVSQEINNAVTLDQLKLFLIQSNPNYPNYIVGQLKKSWENYLEHLTKLEKASFVTNRNLVKHKKNIVEVMLGALKNENLSSTQKIQHFYAILNNNKSVLMQSRDTIFDSVYKYTLLILGDVFTLGFKHNALSSYLWRAKGKDVVEEAEHINPNKFVKDGKKFKESDPLQVKSRDGSIASEPLPSSVRAEAVRRR